MVAKSQTITETVGTDDGDKFFNEESPSDAVVIPQSKGTGLSSEDDIVDAASAALLADHAGGEYVRNGFDFKNHDGTNDQVDIGSGVCYVKDTSSSTTNSRGSGGNPQIQSTSSSGYDTEIPNDQYYCVILPTDYTNLNTSASNLTNVHVRPDVTSQNSVDFRVRSEVDKIGSSHGDLKIGRVNPDDSSADIRDAIGPVDPATGWVKDGEISLTNQSGNSDYSLNGRYDEVRVEIKSLSPTSSGIPWLRVNTNNTSNYDFLNRNQVNSDQDRFELVKNGNFDRNFSGTVRITGRWSPGNDCILSTNAGSGGFIGRKIFFGRQSSIRGPLTTITFGCQGSNFDLTAEVYGKDY